MGTRALELGDPFCGARAKLETWRLGGRRGRGIPEAVWSEAVELARVHGVSKTAVALGLGYYGLQRRLVGGSERAATAEGLETPAFVEVSLGGRGAAECVVVFEDGQGRRLRIELRGAGVSRLESLAAALAGSCS